MKKMYLLASLAAMALAVPAAAITVTSVAIEGSGRAYIGGENVLSGRADLGLSTGGYIPAFCVDIYHTILAGTSTVYHFVAAPASSFTTDFGGHPITAATAGHVFALAQLGLHADAVHANAIQDAIWQLVDPGVTIATEAGFGATPDMVAGARAYGLAHTGTGSLLMSTDGSQSFVTGGVPEPSAWAMMLAGFAAVGMARRRALTPRSLAA